MNKLDYLEQMFLTSRVGGTRTRKASTGEEPAKGVATKASELVDTVEAFWSGSLSDQYQELVDNGKIKPLEKATKKAKAFAATFFDQLTTAVQAENDNLLQTVAQNADEDAIELHPFTDKLEVVRQPTEGQMELFKQCSQQYKIDKQEAGAKGKRPATDKACRETDQEDTKEGWRCYC